MNSEATLKKIIAERLSCVRFGDGEMTAILGRDHYFSRPNKKLSRRLKEVLAADNENLLVCVPSVLNEVTTEISRMRRRWWKVYLLSNTKYWRKYLSYDKTYGDPFISRTPENPDERQRNAGWVKLWKQIFADKNIVVVTGEQTKFGVGNDLLDKGASVKRIICPDVNAFDKYDEILRECQKQETDTLFLIALGQTAKPLVFDLSESGFQAIDVGHLDIAYEWFLRAAKNKIKIPGKRVAEVKGDDHFEVLNDDPEYNAQIIKRIS